ncbi:MAG: hypothetical protein JO073_08925 [Actinobacteria bacterium]|nr:hypothetical protein [Actinomycetota bacterium]
MDDDHLRRHAALFAENARLREAAVSMRGEPSPSFLDFACECGAPDCDAHVRLTLDEYDAIRASGEAVVAESRRLRDEARALHAQARLQYRRAERNIEAARNASRLRHKGPLHLGPDVVWQEDAGWRFACPLGCATVRGEHFPSAADAGAAARAHWDAERERELAELSRGYRA